METCRHFQIRNLMFRFLCPKACRILQINHSIPRGSLTKSRDWALGFASLKIKRLNYFFLKEEGAGRICCFPFFLMRSERKETVRGEGGDN